MSRVQDNRGREKEKVIATGLETVQRPLFSGKVAG